MSSTEDVCLKLQHGPYRTEQVLGRGGMGVVHVARRVGARDTGEQFAAKRILPEFASSASFLRMFRDEAHIGGQLAHPNVVRVVDFGEQDGELLLITEYVDGTSCGQMLRTVAKQAQSFPVPVALYVACEVLEALSYTHSVRRADGSRLGIVHRDVSPGNILLGAMGEVKLADFGVAHVTSGKHDTRPGTLKGKIGYMSPEQAEGGPVDARTDLFSLGVATFEMLTGQPFFKGKNDYEVLSVLRQGTLSPLSDRAASSLPFELRLILATAVARNASERFANAREFSQALREFARHAGVRLERGAMIHWLRGFGVWPVRSGTYTAVRPWAPQPFQSQSDESDLAAATRSARGRLPRD